MKTISFILFSFLLFNVSVRAQPSGYTRGGAEATMKQMKLLFTESFLFSRGMPVIPGDLANSKPAVLAALAESDKVITEFDQKVTEFINSKPTAAVLKSNYSSIISISNRAALAITKAASAKDEYRVMSAVVFLQELYLYKAYINAAIRIYPEAISLQEQLEGLNTAITKQGSREDYIAQMEKNQLDYVKSLRMKKAVASDPSIEKMVKNSYESSWATDKITVVKVHIVSNWVIEKNVMDIPLNKELDVNMAIKKADGTCALAAGTVRCVYEGGGKYGAPYLTMPTPPTTVPCENIPNTSK